MSTRKEKRIKYLGFDDFWFSLFGCLVLGTASAFVFNFSGDLSPFEMLFAFLGSLFFATTDWLINRKILLLLRKRFPDLKDIPKRLSLLLSFTLISVLSVDYLGGHLLASLSDQVNYIFAERVSSLVIIVFLTAMTMAIYEAIYFFVLLQKSIRQEEQAKQAIIQAELDVLRNQAQPHFFFNTLNTLRDMIDQNSKEEAKQFVDKLSDIYRFLLEAGNSNLISLADELKFAKAYIHVQSERFGPNLKVNWTIDDAYLAQQIVPMSLQLLLENAIKHNVVSRSKPLSIDVSVAEGRMVVRNKIQAKSTKLASTKLGLKNIEKRYSLISDQGIQVRNDSQFFEVSLPLLSTTKS